MSNKKCLVRVGARTEAGQEKRQGKAAIPCDYFTTNSVERQPGFIESLLLCGAENAIPRRDLINLTGFPDRELRRLIELERRDGAPILSDNQRGYFLPADVEEVRRFVRSMRHRAAQIRLTALHVEKAVGSAER